MDRRQFQELKGTTWTAALFGGLLAGLTAGIAVWATLYGALASGLS